MLTIQNKRGTKTRLALINPVLAVGEEVTETDTGMTKVGDGVKTWNQLSYEGGGTYAPPDGRGCGIPMAI